MKKDIEWLKEEIDELPCVDTVFISDGLSYMDSAVPVLPVYNLINQLDESEVLSREWISENVEYAYFDMLDGSGRLSSATAIIKPEKLENLLVPKQELPVIPKFVADWIDANKEKYDLVQLFWEIGDGGLVNLDVDRWIEENPNTFARAWLDGYTVEEEQKYYVMNNEKELLLSKNNDDEVITYSQYYPQVRKVLSDLSHYQLTEQEIKDYDERFWAFAVKVEEMEE